MDQPPAPPTAPPATVTLEEALSIAILFQKNGDLDDAEDLYRRLREAAPDHPDVLHFSGVLAHQRGRSDEAVRLIQRSLAVKPDQAGCYSNLGIVLRARGRLDEALDAYRHSIRLEPGNADAYSNMGVLLRAQGKPEEAEAAYRTAIGLAPRHGEAYHNLGVVLAATERVREAVECYCKALTANPVHPSARTRLAAAFCMLGEHEKAVELLEEWLREAPGDAVAQHMLAACSGRDVPVRASDSYVERTFDDFANSFEFKLATLGYRAPHLVAAMLADSGVEPDRRLVVLDAGCGTGLCGPLLRPYAARLVGVDLSARMLGQAREKGVYDELVKQELTAYLETQTAAFDVIVSADTLVYFGALDAVFAAAARALRPGGLLVFTVEELNDPAASGPHRINTHGRYSHHRDYIAAALRVAGFVPHSVQAELRAEGGVPVAGLVVRATARAALEMGCTYGSPARKRS